MNWYRGDPHLCQSCSSVAEMKTSFCSVRPVPSAPAPSRWPRICRTASACSASRPATTLNCCWNKRANTDRTSFPSATRPRTKNSRSTWRGDQVFSGEEGLLKLATLPGADIVLIAIVGTAGLKPALAAIRAGKDIAIASKEILVMAGEIVMAEARKHGVRCWPWTANTRLFFNVSTANRPVPSANSG